MSKKRSMRRKSRKKSKKKAEKKVGTKEVTGTEVKLGKEVIDVRGEDIEVEAKFRYDKESKERVEDKKLDKLAEEKAEELYQEEYLGFVAEDIRKLRDKYDMTQKMLADLVDLSVGSISRYEGGSIPGEDNEEDFKRLMGGEESFVDYYQENKSRLKEDFQKRVQKQIDTIISIQEEEESIQEYEVEEPNKEEVEESIQEESVQEVEEESIQEESVQEVEEESIKEVEESAQEVEEESKEKEPFEEEIVEDKDSFIELNDYIELDESVEVEDVKREEDEDTVETHELKETKESLDILDSLGDIEGNFVEYGEENTGSREIIYEEFEVLEEREEEEEDLTPLERELLKQGSSSLSGEDLLKNTEPEKSDFEIRAEELLDNLEEDIVTLISEKNVNEIKREYENKEKELENKIREKISKERREEQQKVKEEMELRSEYDRITREEERRSKKKGLFSRFKK